MATRRKNEDLEITLAPMMEADLGEVLAIERDCFSSPWTRQSFLFDLHENPYARPVVAREPGGGVVGYGCVWQVHEELKINNLAVRRDRRGRSIGRTLLRYLLEEGRRAGCGIALLEVRPSNAAARALYESEGFVQIDRRRNYYTVEREDALVLALDLDPDD